MSDGLHPYPEYKESGVPWLGRVPSRWRVERLKRLASNVTDQTAINDPNLPYVALEHVESWTGRRISATGDGVHGTVKRLRANDVMFGKLRPYLAKVTRLEEPGYCVGEFFVLRASRADFEPLFYEHLLRCEPFIAVVNSSTFGARMPRAEWSFVGSLEVPIPPPDEQHAIVRFLAALDRKVTRFIRNRRRLIEVLNEEKQAIIHRAVTRGLDESTPLRPTGIDWLGEIPKHWVPAKLVSRYDQCLGKMVDAKRFKGTHAIPYLRNVDVQWDRINTQDLPLIDVAPNERERFSLRGGDLLVCEGGDVGRCAFWRGGIEVCAFQKALHRLRPLRPDSDYPRFLYYCMFTASKLGVFAADGSENTIAHLTGVKLRAHRFAFPPRDEQQRIADYLDSATAELEQVKSRADREIALIREYRTRLIADVVTGKVDVRRLAPAKARASPKAKANVYFQRSVFAAEIVHRLHDEPTFGHVKFEKTIFVCEKRCGVDTGSTYLRKAAGPYDNRALRSIDSQMKKQNWYAVEKCDNRYRYVPMERAGQHGVYFDHYFSTIAERFNEVIELFRPLKTQQCEIVATLYSAWGDLLAKGDASDDQIIEQVLHHWHPSKKAIKEDRWRRALGWMKRKGLTPETGASEG